MTKELRDYFKIDDSHSKIRGFVVITDENGNVLVRKENMIVKSGREMIFSAITSDSNNFDMRGLKALASPKSGLTTEDMTYSDVELGGIDCSIGKVEVGDLEIRFPITVNSNSATINSLCLYTETPQNTLFSRVVFNPIELSSNSTLTINYYIYF